MSEVFITPLKHHLKMRRRGFLTFDTETKDGLKGNLIFCYGLAFQKEKSKAVEVLQSRDTHLDLLFQFFEENWSEHEKLIIYVHNLAFDERFVRKECILRNLDYFIIRSGSSILALDIEQYNVRFIDSMQYLQTSQEKAEIEYNVDPDLCKIDCKDLFNKHYKNWSEMDKIRVLAHNKNDVLALHEIMAQFRSHVWELGNVDILNKISISSIAMAAWRKTLQTPILNPFLYLSSTFESGRYKVGVNTELEKFVRQSYYGGRCEVFNTSRVKNAQYIDRVSMYGAEMDKNAYPVGMPFWSKNQAFLMDLIQTNDLIGFIECRVEYPLVEQYPVLPMRYENEKKVFWDCRTKTGVWSTIELQKAWEHGYLITPLKGLVFPEKAFIFRPYINTNFEIKKQSKGGRKDVAKRFINHLYGKFAQNMLQNGYTSVYFDQELQAIEELERLEEAGLKHLGYSKMIDLEKYQVLEQSVNSSTKSFQDIAIASSITGYARVALQTGIDLCEEHDITVYYCDTDSLTVQNTQKIPQILTIGDELGNWQIEHEFREVQFFAPKLYAWLEPDNTINLKLKGLDKNTRILNLMKCQDLDDIETVFKDRVIDIEEKYCSIGMAARKHAVLVSTATSKTFSFINNKRIFYSDYSLPFS